MTVIPTFAKPNRDRAGMPRPDTAMSSAFLRALVRRAARERNSTKKVTLPTGYAEASELACVLAALGLLDQ
jgi:hypothetical protein